MTVQVEGVSGAERDNVMAALSVVRHRALPGLNDAMVQRMHTRAGDEIREALTPFGYYEVEVAGALEATADGWQVQYWVTPGPPVTVREVAIRVTGPGRHHPEFALNGLPRAGQRLHHPDYERLKQRLQNTAYALGYLDARFDASELRVSVAERAADMAVHLETGERYRFGEVRIEQDTLDDDFLRRYVQFEEGDPFNAGNLLALQYTLSDSGYFTLVEVEAERAAAEGLAVPVIVRAQPAARHRYTAGIGFATDTGPRFIAGWENRRVNRRGHRLGAELTLSEITQSLTTRYMVPLRNPVWERLTFAAGYTREEFGDVDSERAEMMAAWTTRTGAWQRTLSSRLLSEREELSGTSERTTQLIPGVEWLYSGGETSARPRDTRRLSIAITGSDPAIGAPVPYLQVRTRGRLTLPVGERDRLLLRAELGAIASRDAAALSASQRFFAGGDYSVRGYRYNTLGPIDADGNVIGGRYLATAGVEWEHWLSDAWGIGVFVDHGNAFNATADGFNTGAGIGLRWQLPFAVFALDLAHPFDDLGGRRVRIHLNLGGEL